MLQTLIFFQLHFCFIQVLITVWNSRNHSQNHPTSHGWIDGWMHISGVQIPPASPPGRPSCCQTNTNTLGQAGQNAPAKAGQWPPTTTQNSNEWWRDALCGQTESSYRCSLWKGFSVSIYHGVLKQLLPENLCEYITCQFHARLSRHTDYLKQGWSGPNRKWGFLPELTSRTACSLQLHTLLLTFLTPCSQSPSVSQIFTRIPTSCCFHLIAKEKNSLILQSTKSKTAVRCGRWGDRRI